MKDTSPVTWKALYKDDASQEALIYLDVVLRGNSKPQGPSLHTDFDILEATRLLRDKVVSGELSKQLIHHMRAALKVNVPFLGPVYELQDHLAKITYSLGGCVIAVTDISHQVYSAISRYEDYAYIWCRNNKDPYNYCDCDCEDMKVENNIIYYYNWNNAIRYGSVKSRAKVLERVTKHNIRLLVRERPIILDAMHETTYSLASRKRPSGKSSIVK